MKKNILLDVDGTLWDTTKVVAKAWNDAVILSNLSQVEVTAKSLRTLFGKPMNVIADLLFTDAGKQERQTLLALCCAAEKKRLKEYDASLLYPHVKETMYALVKEGKRLFIVSNCQSGYIELFLEKNGLSQTVTDFACFGDNGKQKGQNIALLLQRNHLRTKECVYVGDTAGDKEAAGFADIDFIFADYGFGTVENVPVLRDFSELLELTS